jgi:hypothetical protein
MILFPMILWVSLLAQAGAQEPAAAWKPFTSSAGKFTVLLPGTPVEQRQPVQTALGPVETILFVLELKPSKTSYAVSWSEFSPAALKPGSEAKRLDNARDRVVAGTKGILKGEKRIALRGYPGREVEIDLDGKARVRARIFAVKNRLYQVIVLGPGNWVDGKETSRFLDSFRLTK